MKKLQYSALALIIASSVTIYSCKSQPNDDKNGMDQENSEGEGAIDSSRLLNSDTSSTFILAPAGENNSGI